jgi:hypothetical protein
MSNSKTIRSLVFSVVMVFLSVGQGFSQSAGNSRGIISVDIKNSSPDRVTQAVRDVFSGEGFDAVEQGQNRFVFERPGSRKKDIAYGNLDGGGVIEQVVIALQEKGPALVWVNCDVFIVKGRGSDYTIEDKTKVMRPFAKEYRKLLNKVKVMAEAAPTNDLVTK